ncbi:MAG TPA: methyltransferase domain-containing protein [Steroidobacteraceae bacterium]|nr:methyltransferase domain-containing protein [Steroidobacteraceae bacterium]
MKNNLVQARATAFDGMAGEYDTEFTATPLGSVLRAMVWKRYERRFGGSEHLLEIGCGTGEDAVELARRGHRVFAIDASEQMVRVAQRKAESAGVAHRIQFRCVPMESLGTQLSGMTFDGVYSNFGALNCAADVETLAADLAPRLAPGAPLVWVVMGRHVPWEWAWYLAHGEARKAFRRLSRGGVSWGGLQVSYPTPTALTRALRPHFAACGARSLGFVLPPSYAAAWLNRSPRVLAALTRAERAAQRWQACASLSDHYILEAERLPV